MRSGHFARAVAGQLLVGTVGLVGALSVGCSENNEGNITAPPKAGSFLASGGTGNVIPTGGGTANLDHLDKPLPSSGCNMDPPADQVATIPGTRTGYTEYWVNQTGETLGTKDPTKAKPRQFFVRIPFDYDKTRPYRVVYIGQGCGAVHAGKTNTYPLFNEAQGGNEQAIYVGVSVPDDASNPGCYDNNSGVQSQEWEAFELMHTVVESKFCVDNNRVYVAGYSTGGWLSNMWGCYFGGQPSPPLDDADVKGGRAARKFSPKWSIRGRANVTGSLPPNQPQPCNGLGGGFWIHDALDKSNLIATNIAALNLALKTNGCEGNYEDGPKQDWAPAEEIPGLQGGVCKEYTGCPADVAKHYPLIFCTTNGLGHADQASSAIPAFNKFFDLMNAK